MSWSVPTALKWQEEFGDDLQVIFVGEPASVVERFALDRTWLGKGAMWTNETPVRPQPLPNGGFGTPYSILLSSEGEVLVSGLTSGVHGKLRDAIEAEVGARRGAPPGTPEALEKAWKLFHAGDVAGALEEATKQAGRAELADAATAASTEFYMRAMTRVQRGRWLADHGYPVEARAHLERAVADLEGVVGVVEDAQMMLEFLDSKTMATEMDAARQLAKLEADLYATGRDAGIASRLSALAEDAPTPALQARAAHLAQMAETS